MRPRHHVLRVEPASIPPSQPDSHSPPGVQLSLLVLPLLAVVLVISATIALMFWRRKKTLTAVRRDEPQHEQHELQSPRTPPPPPSAFTPPSPSRRTIKTRNRSQSAPQPPSALRSSLSSPSKAKFSTESIVAIDLRATPPQSPAAESPLESCKRYPTRPWDGSGEFPDTGGLVKDLQPFVGGSYY